MAEPRQTSQELSDASETLRARLARAEETLDALRRDGMETPAAAGAAGEAIFTLCGPDRVLRLVAEAASEGALTVNAEGVILHANRRAAEMLQAPREHVAGTALSAWTGPDAVDRLAALLRDARPGAPSHGAVDLRRPSGDCLPVRITVNRLSAGDIDGATLVISELAAGKSGDTAARGGTRQPEPALLHGREANEQMARHERLEGIGRVIAAIVHDLNNPLQSLRNYLFLAENACVPGSTGRSYLEAASAEITRIAQLVAQLREVHRAPAP